MDTTRDVVRIGFFGDSGVGKTRLIDLLCDQRTLNHRAPRTTGFYTGVLLYSHVATGKDYIFELLEVPSHCKNANSRSFAYHALDAACLVHDLTNARSYQNLWRWLRELSKPRKDKSTYFGETKELPQVTIRTDMGHDAHVEDDLPSIPICLVGSKSDLASFSNRTRSYNIADNLQIRSVGLSAASNDLSTVAQDALVDFFNDVIARKFGAKMPHEQANTQGSAFRHPQTYAERRFQYRP